MPKISERTLKKWRKEALEFIKEGPIEGTIDAALTFNSKKSMCEKILSLTQQLLDQYLLEKK